MGRFLAVVFVAVGFCIALAVEVTYGSRFGAARGHTGGPASAGQNCASCHFFEHGSGGVELLGASRRYRPGVIYDLLVRVYDSDRTGAGFQISAEGAAGPVGQFLLADPTKTRFSNALMDFVTHTEAGVADSVSQWAGNGNAHSFPARWQAPVTDEGPVRFFVSGNAIDNNLGFDGDHYYDANTLAHFAIAGDYDGDDDVDLLDAAAAQRCFDDTLAALDGDCLFLDVDGDQSITLDDHAQIALAMTGPVSTIPAGYLLADAARGGLLYDRWWAEAKLAAPEIDHPLWAMRPDQDSNTRTGATTWRCKECHGWDYKGVDGSYGTGSHRTGFPGIFGTTLSPSVLFDLLKSSPLDVPNGHDYSSAGLTDDDLWDLVRFSLEGVIETGAHITAGGIILGNPFNGQFLYQDHCAVCHGLDGTAINFGSDLDPTYVDDVAAENPWEFLHKVRFGQPGAAMVAYELLGLDPQSAADVAAYAAALLNP